MKIELFASRNRLLKLLLLHVLTLVLGLFLLYYLELSSKLASFAIGWGIGTLNLVLIGLFWALAFKKKFIALLVLIIVLKYAFLAILIYKLTTLSWLDPLVLASGLLSLVGTVTVFSLVRPLRS